MAALKAAPAPKKAATVMNTFTTGYEADEDPDSKGEEDEEDDRIKAWVDEMITGLGG
ncbi:hypothetical protein K432DRAFT_386476 [Lepidopterella palustris CBS 459.81]|uniref:Uncharacterized protein n=1 Tax=Lepidopterella palustris CBS 459.81 TaxID=1314670 RepID=A0A8E2JA77_9PEZI|nr:hypothetical protein K432DRAFT_386476 [Lepidopterella palustris CBS 459.81]